MTTILIKKKDTAGAPAAGDLTNAAGGAEIAVNTATKRLYTKDSGGVVVELGTNPSALTTNLLFSPDATYDIGASGASRPRDQFLSRDLAVGRNLTVGGTFTVTGGINFNGNVTVGDSSADTLTINSTITSNLIFTDNTYDIGASGATRPRTLYLGTSLITPSITDSGLTSGRVTYAGTGGLLTDSANLTFNSTGLSITGAGIGGADDRNLVVTNTAANGYGAMTLVGNSRGGYINFYNGATAQAAIVGQASTLSIYAGSNSSGTAVANFISTGQLGVGLTPTNNSYLIQSNSGIRAGTSVVAQGSLNAYTGAGLFISYESTYGRLEAYDYATPGYKNIGISPNGGNVGVGMVGDSTYGKLTVNGNIAQYGSVASGAELGRIAWFNTATGYDVASIRTFIGAGQVNRGEFGFYTNTGATQTLAMYISRTQFVGIGTSTTPAYNFDVNVAAQSTYAARIINTSGVTSTDSALLVSTSTASSARILSLQNSGSEVFSVIGSGQTTAGGYNASASTQKLNSIGNIKMAGAQNGNVANLIWTRTDASFSMNNETDLRWYSGAGDTDSPSTIRMTLSSADGNLLVGSTGASGSTMIKALSSVASGGTNITVHNFNDTGGGTTYAGINFIVGSDLGTSAIRSIRTNAGSDYQTSLQFLTNPAGATTTPTLKMTLTSTGVLCVNDTTAQYSAKIYANGSIAARNGGVDGTYQDAFVAGYSGNYNERNIIQTAVSSGNGSGFNFQVSVGGGSASVTSVMQVLKNAIVMAPGGTTVGSFGTAGLQMSGANYIYMEKTGTRSWTMSCNQTSSNLAIASGDGLGTINLTSGTVAVSGNLTKGSGSFKIDHPLPEKTDTHHLVHSFIEGPQADLIYRGKVNLVGGTATVNIDTAAGMTEGTFVALCRDVQCFTTNESDWTAVRGSVAGNTLTIEAQDNTSTANISWMVIGERQDKHMYETGWTDNDGKVIVEPLKS